MFSGARAGEHARLPDVREYDLSTMCTLTARRDMCFRHLVISNAHTHTHSVSNDNPRSFGCRLDSGIARKMHVG